MGQPVAIIDIGSNSVRLVAYEGLTRAPTPLYNEKVLCGLGRHVATTGRLDEQATQRALKALARFKILCRTMHIGQVYAIATAAARDAENGKDFIEAAEEACGQKIELLSGEREAKLSGLGVVSGFFHPDGVVGDLGGGSLELIDVAGEKVGKGVTLPLGGLTLQDLSGGSVKKAQKLVRQALSRSPHLKKLKNRTFYAVGGTWRALARLHMAQRDYPLHVMHGYALSPMDGLSFLNLIERLDAKELKNIETISEARRPLLAYGALVLEEILHIGEPKEIVMSALGVREGLLFESLAEARRREDPLILAASSLNILRSRSPKHCEEMAEWTSAVMETLPLTETDEERRLRRAACLLADIGWRAHPDYRGEQSLNIIAHAAFVGVDHPGRVYLALANFFRHEGLSADKASPRLRELAGPRLFERARLLAALMRIAYSLSVAMEGILPRVSLKAKGKELVLKLPADLADLAGERLNNRMKHLGKMLEMDYRIEV